MTKYYTTEDTTPVASTARASVANSIPVFSFVGSVEVGLSGYWSPPHNILLVNGWVQAGTTGSATGGWAILKKTNMTPDGELLVTVNLAASDQKTIFYFDNAIIPKIVTPYDQLYIASFAASGHQNVSIQMYGERV